MAGCAAGHDVDHRRRHAARAGGGERGGGGLEALERRDRRARQAPELARRALTAMADELVDIGTGVRLHYRRVGSGQPLLLAMGTSGSLGMWAPLEATLAERYDVVSVDYRVLGDSERGDGAITVASLADDAVALVDALSGPRAHVLGWSLGSTVAQEVAL